MVEQARRAGARAVIGFEANGGFLLGSDVRVGETILGILPTRDAMLPILASLAAARAAPGTATAATGPATAMRNSARGVSGACRRRAKPPNGCRTISTTSMFSQRAA